MVRNDALVGRARNDADHAGFGHQHRPVGEHVRANGRDADGRHRRENDGAAGGERIGRGAGGRGDDEAIGFVGANELLVHVRVQIDHAGDGGFGQHGVVEGFVGGHHLPAAHHFGGQQLALGDAVLAAEGALQLGVQLVDGDGGQEAQAAEVHGEERGLAPADGARGGEQGAIAAEHDDQVAAFGNFVPRDAAGARWAGVESGLLVDANGHAAAAQPLDERGHDVGGGRASSVWRRSRRS